MDFNFEVFKERYGTEFAEDVKDRIEYCKREELNWKILVVDEIQDVLFKIAFVTFAWAYIWEVNTKAKRISSESYISRKVADEILLTMKSF